VPASTARQVRGLVRNGWTAGARAAATASWAFRSYCGREDERGRVIAGETWRLIVTTSWCEGGN
jgi:hypothetical protein